MSKETLKRLAVVLALNTADHRESAHKNHNLIQNATSGEKQNIACAKELGILADYQRIVDFTAPRLFYELD